ncbi:hypothetical protein BP5796_02179 [Coleophoma crateriformis]|uniref:Major facilitator superfamily (MFS) profile domain-containing protein n=1 Tax=Coleophoma crateriformis TaxID=565419 RepID=A0A3D8SXK7_9HELO|nr:hypothetical protein BP5796_02179 [Coleophoma crateriformis]
MPGKSRPSNSISVIKNTHRVYDGSQRKEPVATTKRKKYGTGRYAGIELEPQPSDSAQDPLNWARWKKELFFLSICMAGSIVGVFKTLFVSVNGVLATQFSVSYTAAAAFTGVPILAAALSGFGATFLAQMWGKRSIYLVSALLMLGASLVNMNIEQNYAAFMVTRILQGLGWGTFETLLVVSIRDIFFVHERNLRMNLYNLVVIASFWGAPILGGFISQSKGGFSDQIMYLNLGQTVSILLLILATPETSFDRPSSSSASTTSSHSRSQTATSITTTVSTNALPTTSPFQKYLKNLHPMPYIQIFDKSEAIHAIKALIAPSTILILLLTMPLVATSVAVAQSLALLFSGNPIFLFPAGLGYLFVTPAVLAVLGYTFIWLVSRHAAQPSSRSSSSSSAKVQFSLNHALSFAGAGTMIGVTGLLSFGVYAASNIVSEAIDVGGEIFLTTPGADISLSVVSLLFGILVAGATMLEFAGVGYISSQVPDSSPSSTALPLAYQTLQNIFIGGFVLALPSWIGDGSELRNTVLAITIVQILLGGTVAAIYWVKRESIVAADARLLDLDGKKAPYSKDLKRWDTQNSFMDDA